MTTRARELLPELEAAKKENMVSENESNPDLTMQLTMFEPASQKLVDTLRELDINELSPREALDKLFKLKKIAQSDRNSSSPKKP